jgi:hypothetical protein
VIERNGTTTVTAITWGDYRWHRRFCGRKIKRRVWKKHMRRMRYQARRDSVKAEQRGNPCRLPFGYQFMEVETHFMVVRL